MVGWTIGGRKSSARRATHPSTIPALGGLTLEIPWNLGQGLGFKPPLESGTSRSLEFHETIVEVVKEDIHGNGKHAEITNRSTNTQNPRDTPCPLVWSHGPTK